MPGDGIELADMAPAEAAQERAERRCRLDREAEDPRRPARPERGRAVDAITTGERRHHEREQLVPDVRPARRLPEVEVGLDSSFRPR